MRIATLLLVAALPLLSAGSDRPDHSATAPLDLGDGWVVADPAAVGMDPDALERLARDFRDGRFAGVHAILAARHGRLVYEVYAPGQAAGRLHRSHSITKSVTALLVGIAVDRGLIPGLEATLAELLPDRVAAMTHPGVREITLADLLTHRAGLAWDEQSLPYDDPGNSHRAMVTAPSWIDHVLGLPLADPPGTRFVYDTGAVHLLGAVLAAAVGMPADTWAERVLLAPLGIRRWSWNRDPEGHPACGGTHGGLRLTPRDLAKLGQLMLDGGMWRGRRVVPESWVREAVVPRCEAGPGRGMGYLWWTGRTEIRGHRLEQFYAAGYGGQSLCVVPELDLVLVFTAWCRPEDAAILGPGLRIMAAALPD